MYIYMYIYIIVVDAVIDTRIAMRIQLSECAPAKGGGLPGAGDRPGPSIRDHPSGTSGTCRKQRAFWAARRNCSKPFKKNKNKNKNRFFSNEKSKVAGKFQKPFENI